MHIFMELALRKDPDINIALANSLRTFIRSAKYLRKLSIPRESMTESKSLVILIVYSLIEGNPQKILRVLHHLLFGVSKKFTQKFLHERCGVNLDIQYMSDGKFFRNISLMLVRN